jgi:hypothetical protein
MFDLIQQEVMQSCDYFVIPVKIYTNFL